MAQERARRTRRLAARYGGMGRAVAVVALVVVLAGVALVTLLCGGRGVSIRRAEEPAPLADPAEAAAGAAAEDDGADDDAGGGEGPGAEAVRETVVVHVDGAVTAPGVYELPEGSRVNDAVLAAGGLAGGADTASLNLAATVSDGEKVHVPVEGEGPAETVAGRAGDGTEGAGGPVNINVASVAELDELPGVGEATAVAIVEDRERNGPFTTPEDLMRVSGIGEKKFAKLEGLICV